MTKPRARGKTEREVAIEGLTNEILTSRFTQELGQKARVERTSIENEHMEQLRDVVSDVGRNLEEIGAVPKGMTYCGSLSIHVFKSDILRTAAFATVSNLGTMDFTLADGALRELTGATLVSYGRSRKKLRSGF